MLPASGWLQADHEVASLLQGAGQRLLASHDLLRQRHPAALDLLLQDEVGAPALVKGGLRLQSELLIRAQWACDARAHTATARRDLETVVAAFAAIVCALEVLDEPADGNKPAADLGLALLGESIELFRGLPEPLASRLLADWGALWTRCAAARTLDTALLAWPDLTVSQAIRVATSSGLVTQWAVTAGALIAGAAPGLVAPLADFGRSLGTAQKLLHDLHALAPRAHRSDDLRRRVEHGALDQARACVDQCRRRAADDLRRFADAGGDPTPLAGLLDGPPERRAVQTEVTQP